MHDLKLTLKSCVRITKDEGASKKHPKNQNPPKPMKQTNKPQQHKQTRKKPKKLRRSQVEGLKSIDSSFTCQNEKVVSNGLSECDFLQTHPLYFYGLTEVTVISLFLLVAILIYFQFFMTFPPSFVLNTH